MNALQSHLQRNHIDEVETMNILQTHGVISDNCVSAKDVANQDAERACEWLEENLEVWRGSADLCAPK